MKSDLLSKILLTVIAVCLINISFGSPLRVNDAHASSANAAWVIDTVLGRIDGSKITNGIIKLRCTSY